MGKIKLFTTLDNGTKLSSFIHNSPFFNLFCPKITCQSNKNYKMSQNCSDISIIKGRFSCFADQYMSCIDRLILFGYL